MLEYALKQERAKYHKLKYGTELNQGDLKMPTFESEETKDTEAPTAPQNSQLTWKQGRQLLRQYLQEVGYTDTILDVRSQRVRSLLGLSNSERNGSVETKNLEQILNGGESPKQKGQEIKRPSGDVLETFNFLENADDSDEEEENDMIEGIPEGKDKHRINKHKIGNEGLAADLTDDPDTEEALKEFDFLVTAEDGEGAGEARSSGDGTEWGKLALPTADFFSFNNMLHVDKDDLSPTTEVWDVDQGLISKLKEQYKKERKGKKGVKSCVIDQVGNHFKYVVMAYDNVDFLYYDEKLRELMGVNRTKLYDMIADLGDDELPLIPSGIINQSRSASTRTDHEGARAEEAEPITFPSGGGKSFIMGSDDVLLSVLGLGDLADLTVTNDADYSYDDFGFTLMIRSASLDVEPIYTFRAHIGPVLSLAISSNGEQCFSGGIDATIQWWNMPSPNVDPYDTYEPNVLAGTLVAHTDAVWGLAYSGIKNQLLSCSADGTVRLWNPQEKLPCICTYNGDKEHGIPTSVDFIGCDPAHMVTSFNTGSTVIYDLETSQSLVMLSSQIDSGKMIHSMVAHLDAVTSLAVDPNGIYLMSGSHDCSIRLWNLDSKTCVQEITAHRKKLDESIYDVAFHPSKAYIASAGADALAKVFV
eukprot:bmy_17802T0